MEDLIGTSKKQFDSSSYSYINEPTQASTKEDPFDCANGRPPCFDLVKEHCGFIQQAGRDLDERKWWRMASPSTNNSIPLWRRRLDNGEEEAITGR
jgi:hypothetical protein